MSLCCVAMLSRKARLYTQRLRCSSTPFTRARREEQVAVAMCVQQSIKRWPHKTDQLQSLHCGVTLCDGVADEVHEATQELDKFFDDTGSRQVTNTKSLDDAHDKLASNAWLADILAQSTTSVVMGHCKNSELSNKALQNTAAGITKVVPHILFHKVCC